MEIVSSQPQMAPGLARCYNEMAAAAPYCAPVGEEWFRDLGRLARAPCREESVLVAQEGGEVVGFVHVAVAAPATEDWHLKGQPGVIRFLAYRPGQRPVGKALLEAAEGWLREHGRREVVAGHCDYLYPFYYLPFGHISERISHLPPLFGLAGYAIFESEVFSDWPDFEAPVVAKPDLKVELTSTHEQIGTFGPGIAVRAKRGKRQVGECLMMWLGRDSCRPELADWCFCESLQVSEPLQGRGLGKHLLVSGLAKMREAGARHAMISTDWNNYRAYLFYTNFGYRFLDRSFAFRRRLGRR